ncbi:MAG: DUF5667 domain-containing protein [Candidatus Falkowbacteria bacterium]
MENLEKLLSELPQNKLSRQADLKIKFKLYKIIILNNLASIFDFSNLRIFSTNKALGVAAVILLICGTTSVYAYASNDILPGSQLYPVKIALEKIEQKITTNNTAKIANLEKFSERRLNEAVVLSQKKQESEKEGQKINEDIKKNIATELSNHEAVANHINNLEEGNNVEALITETKKNDQAEINYLDKIGEYAASNKNQEILDKVNEAKDKIKKQEYKRGNGNGWKKDEQLNEGVSKQDKISEDNAAPAISTSTEIIEANRNESSTPEIRSDRERRRERDNEDR